MPIEIKELHIRVNVNDEDCRPVRQNVNHESEASGTGVNTDKIVEQCVERVLEVMKREKQR